MAWGLANESLACVPMATVIGSGKDTGSKPGQPIRGFQDTREGRQDLSAGCQGRQAAETTAGCWLVRSPLLLSVRNRVLGALRGHRSPGFSPEDTASSTPSLPAQVPDASATISLAPKRTYCLTNVTPESVSGHSYGLGRREGAPTHS